jgi:hypothetical protein
MLLALRSDTTIDPYRQFFSEARWALLDDMFASDACRVLKVASYSPLLSSTLLGLTAAKTCVCGTVDFAESDCPACLPLFSSVLHSLPQAPRQHTVLLCPLQRCVMDDINPPLALPSGWYDAFLVTHICHSCTLFLLSFMLAPTVSFLPPLRSKCFGR